MTINQGLGPGLDLDSGMGLRLLLHWRIRCVARRVAIDATSGVFAAQLCTSIIRTVHDETNVGVLEFHLRRWRSDAAPAEARGALLCLAELTSEMSAEVFEEFPPPGLGVILETLSEASAAAAIPDRPLESVDPVTGVPGPQALERSLESLVRRALLAKVDLSVAVVELGGTRAKTHRAPKGHRDDDPQLAILASTLRQATSKSDAIYLWGPQRFVVMSWDADKVAARQNMLQAVVRGGPPFHWGVACLSDVGPRAADHPDLLLMLAEADLHLRRRDLHNVQVANERRRRAAVVLGAAALLLAFTLSTDITQAPSSPPHQALRIQTSTPKLIGSGSPGAPEPRPPSLEMPVTPPDIVSNATPSPPAAATVAFVSHAQIPGTTATTIAPPPPAPPSGSSKHTAPGHAKRPKGSAKNVLVH